MKKIVLLIFFLILVALAGYFYYEKKLNPPIQNELTLFGNVDVRVVDIGFRVKGRLKEMLYEEGDTIAKDTLLASLDIQPYDELLKEAEHQLLARKIEFENSQNILQRRQELYESGGVSKEEYQNALYSMKDNIELIKVAEASLGVAKVNLDDTKVFAPIEGTILTRIKEPGSVVREADPVYTLSITDPVWIRAYVSEESLGLIYPGMKVFIHTDTQSLPVYEGHIGFISPQAEFTPKTVETLELRTDLVYRLRVIVDNPDKFLKQGMPVTVKILLKRE
jgi:HlyD family secretion protein